MFKSGVYERKRLPTLQRLTDGGWRVYVLSGTEISDRRSFFVACSRVFPLDPPLGGHDKWDALSDSLFEGLRSSPAGKIAILWSRADKLRTVLPDDYQVALGVFRDVADLLRNPKMTSGPTKTVCALVESEGGELSAKTNPVIDPLP